MIRSRFLWIALSAAWSLAAQEADAGLDLRLTAAASAARSEQLALAPRYGGREDVGFRIVAYPLWKLSRQWSLGGAVQFRSRPYFVEDFEAQGRGLKADVLQANLAFSQFWTGGSVVARAGVLSSAFGSYLLHYDDSENALIDKPVTYGYYGKGVTTLGLAGAQVDLSEGQWDVRAQLVNSSPANRRTIWDHDQYANWAGGAGYTIRQGFHVGTSIYRGPYLNRGSRFFTPGESSPVDLPATAFGFDGEWAHGHWNAAGEWQRFVYTYHAVPTYHATAGYGEIRRALNARWYAAERLGYTVNSYSPARQVHEFAIGYRATNSTLVKIAYQMQRAGNLSGTAGDTVLVQVVCSLHVLSLAR